MKNILASIMIIFVVSCSPAYANAFNEEQFYESCISNSVYPPLPSESDVVYCECQVAQTKTLAVSGSLSTAEFDNYVVRVTRFFETSNVHVLGSSIVSFNIIYRECLNQKLQYLEENPMDVEERIRQIMNHQNKVVF